MAGGSKNLDGITASNQAVTPAAPVAVNLSVKTEEKPAAEALLNWTAPSFGYKDKNTRWFAVAVVAVLALIIFFVFSKDWFSVGIVAVVSFVLFWYVAKVRPTDVDYSISDLGITAGQHFYSYSDLHSYWLVYNNNIQTLNIAFTKKYLPSLVINVSAVNPLVIKDLLSVHLPEQEKRGESLVDRIIRLLGL